MSQNFLKAQIQLCQDMVSTQSRHKYDQCYDMSTEDSTEEKSGMPQYSDLKIVRDLSVKLEMIKADLNAKLDAGIEESRELEDQKESIQHKIEEKSKAIFQIEKSIYDLISNGQKAIEKMEEILEVCEQRLKEDEEIYQCMVNELDSKLNEQERRKEGVMAEKKTLEKQLAQSFKEFGDLQKQLLLSFSSSMDQISN